MTNQRYTDYDTWAWLYNQTMGSEYSENQLQSLQTILLSHLPPQAKLMDLCCGTGQLMQQLSQQGYQLTGLDGSQTMLNYAGKNAPKSTFILADAREFSLPETFDAVVSTSASLNHVMSLGELKAVFRNVYDVLSENGLFLFDINHHGQMAKWWRGKVTEGKIETSYAWLIIPEYNSQDRQGYFQVKIFQASPSTKINWLKKWLYKLLSLRRLTRFRLKILANFPSWEPQWQCCQQKYSVKGYTSEEVQSALEEVGFSKVEVCNNEGKTPLDDNHSAYFLSFKSSC